MKVRYYGHVGQRTGYGRAAEATCLAMLSAGIDLEIRPLAPADHLDFTRPTSLPLASYLKTDAEMTAPDVVFVHTLPFDCARVIQIAGLRPASRLHPLRPETAPRLVAYTTWEGASEMPDSFRHALEVFDAAYFPSSHNRDRAPSPFDLDPEHPLCVPGVLPHAYDPNSDVGHRRKQVGDRYRFYYVGAWNGRKNPAGLIRAYLAEFTPQDRVELVMQCAGGSQADFIVAAHSTGLERHEMAAIDFRDQFATEAEVMAMHRDFDCFVSATRGEAWNFPAFDAMIAGRNIIVPRNMGSDDFLADTAATRYPGFLAPAQGDVRVVQMEGHPPGTLNLQFLGAHGLTGKSMWMEPDMLLLSSHMRIAFESQGSDLAVNYKPAERFSYAVVGKQLRKELEAL